MIFCWEIKIFIAVTMTTRPSFAMLRFNYFNFQTEYHHYFLLRPRDTFVVVQQRKKITIIKIALLCVLLDKISQ